MATKDKARTDVANRSDTGKASAVEISASENEKNSQQVDVTKFSNPVLKTDYDLGDLSAGKTIPARTAVKFLGAPNAEGLLEIEVKLSKKNTTRLWIEPYEIVDAGTMTLVTAESTPPEKALKDTSKEKTKVAAKTVADSSSSSSVANTTGPKTETASTDATVSPADMDDGRLDRIKGIADATKKSLNKGGVDSLTQLAAMSSSDVQAALRKGEFKGRSTDKDYIDWIKQAKTFIGDKTPIKKDLSTPFKDFPRQKDLDAITNTKEQEIAPLEILQSHLLNAKLICDPGAVSKTKLIFEMTRLDKTPAYVPKGEITQDKKQTWVVGVKRRAREKPAFIATFKKSPDKFFFQWLPEAAENKYAEFLRNCHLKLLAYGDEESTVLALREPEKVHDLRYSTGNMTNELEVDIPAIPNLENIVIELLPPKGQDLRPLSMRIEPDKPGTIMLSRRDNNGFMWIQIAGDLNKSKLKLRSNVMARYGNQVSAMSSLEEISAFIGTLKQIQTEANVLNAAKQKEPAAKGRSKKAKEQNAILSKEKADFSKRAKQADAVVKKAIDYKNILEEAAGESLNVRVYAKFGNYTTVLVVTDKNESQPAEPESKKK